MEQLTEEQKAQLKTIVAPAVKEAAEQVIAEELPNIIKAQMESMAEKVKKDSPDVPEAIRSFFDTEGAGIKAPVKGIPANVKRYGRLHNFQGENAELKAYRFGMWCLATAVSHEGAQKYCEANNIPVKFVKTTHQEGKNEVGGFLVPEEFGNDLVDLRERYGAFRRNTRIVPMKSDTRHDPRRTGGLNAYWVGESEAGTLAVKGWDRVGLTAKKMMVLAKYSSELDEDAVITIGDDLAGEIAYAFELKTDEAGFNGDGTSQYGHIVGVRQRLIDVYGTDGGVGLIVGSGNAYAELTLADHNAVVGALPEYADFNAKWYCSKSYWANVMQKLITAAGGVTAMEIMNGARQKNFLGYPVEVSQVMPKTAANSQIPCFFGDLRLASRLGDRRQMTVAFSEHALSAFENDEIVIRATERLDINVHDVGSETEAGPVVGLITASS